MKFGDVENSVIFGNRFLDKVYILCSLFEVLQSHCKPHLNFSKEPGGKKPINVIKTPVLNPNHRGVLDKAEKAD